jgi:hypothetical protein
MKIVWSMSGERALCVRQAVSGTALCPVAFLVFFPAAAGAGVVAADLVVISLNRLSGDWLVSAIEDECWLGA